MARSMLGAVAKIGRKGETRMQVCGASAVSPRRWGQSAKLGIRAVVAPAPWQT
jgi:hypothetical protein